MGFGSFFKKVAAPVATVLGGALGGPVGAVLGGTVAGSLWGSSGDSASDINNKNLQLAYAQMQYQKELAQNQVQWRVEDAKKAGLHPLAGLGVSPSSYSPVSANLIPSSGGSLSSSDMMQIGQDIDRSILQAKTKEEQKDALRLQNQSIALDLRGKDLNNQILEAELASRRARLAQMMGPPTPASSGLPAARYAIPGQSESRMPNSKGSVSAGDGMYQFMETSVPGVFTLQPGNDWAQLFEDKGMVAELWPLAKTYAVDLANRSPNKSINGMVWSDVHGGWVKKGSKLDTGKRTWFVDWLRRRAYSRR